MTTQKHYLKLFNTILKNITQNENHVAEMTVFLNRQKLMKIHFYAFNWLANTKHDFGIELLDENGNVSNEIPFIFPIGSILWDSEKNSVDLYLEVSL